MPVKTSEAMTAEKLLDWSELEMGDMIQFDLPERLRQAHNWAIYVGDKK
jgi:hypothetical protein